MPRLSKIGAAALAAFGWTSGGAATVTATYLQVAGGGGGGQAYGGGGGAGGYLTGSTTLNTTLSYTVIVGAGGPGATFTTVNGIQGSNSQFGTLTASVGGGYGSYTTSGGNGGSGGGGSGAGPQTGGTGTVGQGNNGGTGADGGGGNAGGGGGGGAGAVGSNGSLPNGGAGGVGLASSISGSSTYYAGGGGGGAGTGGGSTGGAGGNGGGGSGAANTGVGNPGSQSTGGGGGGGARYSTAGGNGGSGVVIISYAGSQQFGGGIVTSVGGNTIHTFTTSGTLSPLSSLSADYLIVAGGGGGGFEGGGGAGGFLSGSAITIDTNSTYLVTVGSGGVGNTSGSGGVAGNGTNSSFSIFATAAVGGGGGGNSAGTKNGLAGGSGGGGSSATSVGATGGTGGAATSGQGNAGGTGYYAAAAGGGGAGAAGSNASAGGASPSYTGAAGGAGGVGLASSISGTSTYYAGGGGGGCILSGSQGAGGNGGGGAGALNAATAGTINTGGGGGGSWNAPSGNGGSGIVIVRYAGSTQQMAGGTVTITGGYVIHTFTSSGYLTPLTYYSNSLRFRSSASAYLNRTPTVAGNQKTWTFSAWVKRGTLGTSQALMGAYVDGNNQIRIGFTTSDTIDFYSQNGGTITVRFITNAVYRDPAAWYHIVVSLNAASGTGGIYINGVLQTLSTNINTNANTYFNAAIPQYVGQFGNGTQYFDGYMTNINFIDGQALTPNSFGTYNSYGVWQPINYGGSYGQNGFYLPFTGSTSYAGSFNGSSQSLLAAGATSVSFPANFTFEYWFYPTNTSGTNQGGGLSYRNSGFGTGGFQTKYDGTTGIMQWIFDGGGTTVNCTGISNNKWNHIAVVRSGTTLTAYVNGAPTSSATGFSTNVNGGTSNFGIYIGDSYDGNHYYAQGYISNLRMVTSAVYTTGFNPPTSALTAISGTQLLTLQNSTIIDNSSNAFTLTNNGSVTTSQSFPFIVSVAQDKGPAGNNWTPNNFGTQLTTSIDNMTDVPTLTSATAANTATLNPLLVAGGAGQTFSNGNLTVTDTSGNGFGSSTIAVSSGKFYCEVTYVTAGGGCTIGIWQLPFNASGTFYTANTNYRWYNLNGVVYNAAGATGNTYATYTTGDVIGMALDMDSGTITFYKNGVAQSSAITGLTGTWMFGVNPGGSNASLSANFGQQPFKYTPPSGFVALNTYNM